MLRQEVTKPLNVGGMAKADIGDHRGHRIHGGLFVESDHSARVKIAELMRQFPTSVGAFRNQKDRAVARHRSCPGLADGFQSKSEPNFTMGRNLPIFGEAMIAATFGFALTGHGLHGV
jgi:hypothetical protein